MAPYRVLHPFPESLVRLIPPVILRGIVFQILHAAEGTPPLDERVRELGAISAAHAEELKAQHVVKQLNRGTLSHVGVEAQVEHLLDVVRPLLVDWRAAVLIH